MDELRSIIAFVGCPSSPSLQMEIIERDESGVKTSNLSEKTDFTSSLIKSLMSRRLSGEPPRKGLAGSNPADYCNRFYSSDGYIMPFFLMGV